MSSSLIVMRLIDMTKQHPSQDNSRVCDQCRKPVGIYPSGQRALRKDPSLGILCSRCADPVVFGVSVARSVDEFISEIRDSVEVKKA